MKNALVTILKSAGVLVVGLVFYVATALFSGSHYEIPPNDTVPANAISTPTPTPQLTMLQLVNQVRAKAGKAALVEDPTLDQAAQKKVADQVYRNYWQHHLPGESTFQFFPPANYAYPLAENIAKCYATDPQVVQGWTQSPEHYAAMVGNYDQFGYAETTNPKDQNCTYVVAYFREY